MISYFPYFTCLYIVMSYHVLPTFILATVDERCYRFSDCASCTANTNGCQWCDYKKCISASSNCSSVSFAAGGAGAPFTLVFRSPLLYTNLCILPLFNLELVLLTTLTFKGCTDYPPFSFFCCRAWRTSLSAQWGMSRCAPSLQTARAAYWTSTVSGTWISQSAMLYLVRY